MHRELAVSLGYVVIVYPRAKGPWVLGGRGRNKKILY